MSLVLLSCFLNIASVPEDHELGTTGGFGSRIRGTRRRIRTPALDGPRTGTSLFATTKWKSRKEDRVHRQEGLHTAPHHSACRRLVGRPPIRPAIHSCVDGGLSCPGDLLALTFLLLVLVHLLVLGIRMTIRSKNNVCKIEKKRRRTKTT